MPFPEGFLWGAATAAHQVEGGNRHSDWWEAEERGLLPHRSGRACEGWTRYADDLELARALGHNAARFSVEWARVEPRDGELDEAALAHYVDVVRAARARSIEPFVTLQHFTLPAWIARRGGWLEHAGSDSAPSVDPVSSLAASVRGTDPYGGRSRCIFRKP